MAHKEKTGARSLISVMEKLLVGFERMLPSTQVNRFTVTEELVEGPRGVVEALLNDEMHPSRRSDFRCGGCR